MRKLFILTVIAGFLLSVSNFLYAQEQEEEAGVEERIYVLREAKEDRKTTVAVGVYLLDDILEVKVIVRMYAEKPKIYNLLIVGPKLGRLSCKTRKELLATMEEEEPYPTSKRGGFILFAQKNKDKKAKGTLIKELFRFNIPKDKIIPGKRYQLWVSVDSKTRGGGVPLKFKFDLKNLPQLILQQDSTQKNPYPREN